MVKVSRCKYWQSELIAASWLQRQDCQVSTCSYCNQLVSNHRGWFLTVFFKVSPKILGEPDPASKRLSRTV